MLRYFRSNIRITSLPGPYFTSKTQLYTKVRSIILEVGALGFGIQQSVQSNHHAAGPAEKHSRRYLWGIIYIHSYTGNISFMTSHYLLSAVHFSFAVPFLILFWFVIYLLAQRRTVLRLEKWKKEVGGALWLDATKAILPCSYKPVFTYSSTAYYICITSYFVEYLQSFHVYEKVQVETGKENRKYFV